MRHRARNTAGNAEAVLAPLGGVSMVLQWGVTRRARTIAQYRKRARGARRRASTMLTEEQSATPIQDTIGIQKSKHSCRNGEGPSPYELRKNTHVRQGSFGRYLMPLLEEDVRRLHLTEQA